MEKKQMRTYEVMIIVRPDLVDEEMDKLISTLESHMVTAGGTVKSVERMGKRRLAYVIRRFHDGVYILFTIEGEGGIMHEVERRLRVAEPVIKFLSVRVDEEQKRLDKMKKHRDAHVKGRPQAAVQVAAPVAPVEEPEATPEATTGEESAPVTT